AVEHHHVGPFVMLLNPILADRAAEDDAISDALLRDEGLQLGAKLAVSNNVEIPADSMFGELLACPREKGITFDRIETPHRQNAERASRVRLSGSIGVGVQAAMDHMEVIP